jgi:hypothetical protein
MLNTVNLPQSREGDSSMQRNPTLTQHSWGLVAAIGVGLVAVILTVAQGLPYGHDSVLHLYRVVTWDFLIRHSLQFRWCPFLGYGYGSPLFNYYPPLLYALTQLFLLAGLKPMLALRVILGLALVGGATGMYCWTRDLLGPGPGVVAATAFVFSPYVMCTLLNRASFPGVLNLAWMPWGAWTLHRYASGRGLACGALCAVIVAATLLTHLFSAYLFIASLLAYVFGLSLFSGEVSDTRIVGRSPSKASLYYLNRLLRLSWPIGLGLGLSAFFWLPAVREVGRVQIERMLLIADPSTGQGLMLPWEVFAGPILPDDSIPVAAIPPRLNGIAAGLAFVGIVSGLIALRSRSLKIHLTVGVIVVGLAVFMHTPASRWLWQTVPLLRLTQFPFRFLSVASLWLALLAGAGSAALLAVLSPGEKAGAWNLPVTIGLVLGLCLILALYALGWPSIAYHRPDMPTSLDAALQFERDPTTMGLQTGGEYRIRTVSELPPPESGPGINQSRLDVASLPAGARVVDAHYDWSHYTVVIDSPQPFQVIFRTFDFPGWWAAVNGQRVSIYAN